MSRGHGHIQRAILALIASDADGAWKLGDICKHVYPDIEHDLDIEKKHRVAVTRALHKMTLPGTWCVRRMWSQGNEYCLRDDCNLMSMARKEWIEDCARGWNYANVTEYMKARPDRYRPGKETTTTFDRVQRAIKYRDSDEIGRLEMDIEMAEARVSLWTADPNCEWAKAARDERDKLKAKLTELKDTKAA